MRFTEDGTPVVMLDMSPIAELFFEDVPIIRDRINEIFAPLNIKMISKRAVRPYPNGYSVFVLYCNLC